MSESNMDKFDEFLEASTVHDRNMEALERAMQDVYRQLSFVTSGRVFDPDQATRLEQMAEYAAASAREYLDNPEQAFAEMDMEVPGDAEEMQTLLFKKAAYAAQLRDAQEQNLVGEISLLMALNTQGASVEQLTELKKKCMVDLMLEGWSYDDPMLQFFARLAPGESLDINSEEDLTYFADAMANAAAIEEKAGYFQETARLVAETIDLNTDLGQTIAHGIAADMTTIAYNASLQAKRGGGMPVVAQRDEQIMNICRVNGIHIAVEDSDNIVKAILEVFDAQYPLLVDESEADPSSDD